MNMPQSLSNRRAVVTGGTRGIGFAIAARLREDGADVTVTGTQPDGGGPEGTEFLMVDFGAVGAIDKFADNLRIIAPDILVNNAGLNQNAPFSDIDLEVFDAIHRINLRAPVALMKAVLPKMQQRKWGRVINIGSVWSKLARSGRASYAASKFGLDGVTAAAAAEVAADGVLINMVSPGIINTELTRRTLAPDKLKEILTDVPARRLGQPEEIAAFVSWLAGPDNSFISGQNIAIDGGFTRV